LDFSDTTVVIPALEEPALWDVVSRTRKALPGAEILVLWKGYNNKAPIFKEKGVRTIKQESIGKGTVIIQVQKHRYVKTEIIGFIDGDLTYDPRDFVALVGMVRKGYDMALGNRFSKLDRKSMPIFIEFGNKVITVVANLLYFMWLGDSQTGIRALRTSVFQSLDLRENGFGIESEMNIKMRKESYRIGESPARYYVRVGESKQMKFIDGIRLLVTDFKFLRYSPRTRS
jgi:hypothetical protein